jgi:hypothetical protein
VKKGRRVARVCLRAETGCCRDRVKKGRRVARVCLRAETGCNEVCVVCGWEGGWGFGIETKLLNSAGECQCDRNWYVG